MLGNVGPSGQPRLGGGSAWASRAKDLQLALARLGPAHAVGERDALFARLHDLGAAHEFRKVEFPIVRRVIGAVVVAELALVAEVDDLTCFTRVELRRLLFVAIDRLE